LIDGDSRPSRGSFDQKDTVSYQAAAAEPSADAFSHLSIRRLDMIQSAFDSGSVPLVSAHLGSAISTHSGSSALVAPARGGLIDWVSELDTSSP
jgi:hypothetical protein